jgi:hypothetical protein
MTKAEKNRLLLWNSMIWIAAMAASGSSRHGGLFSFNSAKESHPGQVFGARDIGAPSGRKKG